MLTSVATDIVNEGIGSSTISTCLTERLLHCLNALCKCHILCDFLHRMQQIICRDFFVVQGNA